MILGSSVSSNSVQYVQFIEGEKEFKSSHTCFSRFRGFYHNLSLEIECKLCLYKRVLRKYPAPVILNSNASEILFLISADKKSKPCQFVQLIVLGANPNYVNLETLESPLHLLATAGLFDCIYCLLKFGANANTFDKFGKTPLINACKSRKASCRTVRLLANIPDVFIHHTDQSGCCALDYSAARNDVWTTRCLLLAGAKLLPHKDSSQLISNKHNESKLKSLVVNDSFPPDYGLINAATDEEEEEKEDEHKQVVDVARHPTSEDISRIVLPPLQSSDSLHSAVSTITHRSPALPYGVDLQQRLERCLDYHCSAATIKLIQFRQRDPEVVIRLIGYRQIEVERDGKHSTGLLGAVEEPQLVLEETKDTSKFWKLPDMSKRSQIRQDRKVKRIQLLNASGRGGGRTTVQQREEAVRWAQKKEDLQRKVDKQYNVEVNLKGMFK